jgi:hypothetical protein
LPTDPIEAIRSEIFRLRADPGSVGEIDAIRVSDRGHGSVLLKGSPRRRDFHWFGSAEEILARLVGLPDEAGPEGIRSEFADGVA